MLTVQDVKTCGYVAPIIAAVATFIRLGERIRTRRFGWDDGFATLSLLILVVFDTGLFVHFNDKHLSHLNRYAMYYVIAQSFYGIVWTARLSILFTIIRITSERSPLRRVLYVVAVSYILIWIGLAIQLLCICETHPAWKHLPSPQCPLETQVPIAQLITDLYADSILVMAPLYLLRNLEAGNSQRTRLMVAFSASITTTITSLVHAYYILVKPGSLPVIFTAIIELSSSLFVCNLPILVGTFARLVGTRVPWTRISTHSHSRGSESHELSHNSNARFSLRSTRSRSISFRRDLSAETKVGFEQSVGEDSQNTIKIDLRTGTEARTVDVNPDDVGVYPDPIKNHPSEGSFCQDLPEDVYDLKLGTTYRTSPV